MVESPIFNFITNTENPTTNFDFGYWYETQCHYAPALTYYLRAAERTDDVNFSYKCLIRGFYCYHKQKNREVTAKSLLYQALCVLPKRPEAYFILSKYYEEKEDWMQAYSYASIGLECCDFNLPKDLDIPEYPGKYSLVFQKAICGYWWGKGMETRQLLQDLVDNHWDEMEDYYKIITENNILNLGVGPAEIAFVKYNKQKHSNLRFKFNESDCIENNHSQVYQDIFVLSMTNGKRNGTYLEVGGGDPYWGNNTALLEKNYDWSGVSIEYKKELADKYKNERKNTLLCTDALKLNYKKLLDENYSSKIIDYLQLDCEPARSTFEILISLPLDEYKFAVITYEHDYSADVTRLYREKSRRYLESNGYILIANDIGPTDWYSFEDWWVHPELINSDIIDKMKSVNLNKFNQVEEYMFNR